MGSNQDDSASNIYLTVPSEFIYGEGEEFSITPCYDEVFQNFSQRNCISSRFNERGNHDNNHANNNNSSNNYYNNVNIYESLRKKKECYLRDLINTSAFSSTQYQQTPSSKKQKVKQILEIEISKHKGKVCFVILLFCLAVNIGALIYKYAQSVATSNGPEKKINYSCSDYSNDCVENYPAYYNQPWYHTDTGIYARRCDIKNYKTLFIVNIVKITQSCDKVPECVKQIREMAMLPSAEFNFILDQEGNIYKGLNWQCTMISDTLVIGYFDNSDHLYCMDCSRLLNYFIHMPEVIRYGKKKGLLKPVLNVTSDCYNMLMNTFFKTMD